MNIKIYQNFTKRVNSTKQPSADSGTEIDVKLKTPSTVDNPVFQIMGNYPNINYVYAFGNYYFVPSVSLINNDMTEIQCIKDPMATFKSEIGAYNCFIERASTGYNALDYIQDNFVSQKCDYCLNTSTTTAFGSDVLTFPSGGRYVLSIMGDTGLLYYYVASDKLQTLLSFSNSYDAGNFDLIENIDDADTRNMVMTLFNPNNFIMGCYWSPFEVPGAFGAYDNIHLGRYDTGATGWPITKNCISFTINALNKPTLFYSDWRDYDPSWTECIIRLPGVGATQIDPKFLKSGTSLEVVYYIDLLTGGTSAIIRNGVTGSEISRLSGNMYVPIQLGGNFMNESSIANAQTQLSGANARAWGGAVATVGAIAGIVGTVASGGTLAPVLGLGATAIGGVASTITASNQITNAQMNLATAENTASTWTVGSTGSRAEIFSNQDIKLSVRQKESCERPTSTLGYPIYKNGTISSYGGGYVKCVNASPPISGNCNDLDYIIKALNGGFYYE